MVNLLERRIVETIMRPRRGLDPRSGKVALTFDDGPHPLATDQIVEILGFYQVPATFFVVGERVREHQDLVRLLHDSGHQVGSHSQTHPDPWKIGLRSLHAEYQGAARLVSSFSAPGTPRLFRPPKGHVDFETAVVTRILGLRTWLWTIDSNDWQPGIGADDILLCTAGADSGDVILLHDGLEAPLDDRALDRSATVSALPRLIESLRAKGLRLVVLPA